jgi:L-threonylcarbamoyladenylate synthase
MDKRCEEIEMATYNILEGNREDLLHEATKAIGDGYVIVAPLENGYVLLADAFFHDAVRSLHVLRGDALGVAAQVLIPSIDTLDGIAREVSEQARALMTKFWPGPLSMNLRPQRGLNWDLGDMQKLDQISVRIPTSDFVLELLKRNGPLAVASAATTGAPPILDPAALNFSESQVAAIFTQGVIASVPATTIIESDDSGSRIKREGAISTDEIIAVAPDNSGD